MCGSATRSADADAIQAMGGAKRARCLLPLASTPRLTVLLTMRGRDCHTVATGGTSFGFGRPRPNHIAQGGVEDRINFYELRDNRRHLRTSALGHLSYV